MNISTVGICDAKNRFSEILERVEAGEIIAVTRHGRQIALLTPVCPPSDGRQEVARLRKLRAGSRFSGLKIRQLRDEGWP